MSKEYLTIIRRTIIRLEKFVILFFESVRLFYTLDKKIVVKRRRFDRKK
jgi:hypothetical protein